MIEPFAFKQESKHPPAFEPDDVVFLKKDYKIYDEIEDDLYNKYFKENRSFVIRNCGLFKHFTDQSGNFLETVDDVEYCIIEAIIEDNFDPLEGHIGVVRAEDLRLFGVEDVSFDFDPKD